MKEAETGDGTVSETDTDRRAQLPQLPISYKA